MNKPPAQVNGCDLAMGYISKAIKPYARRQRKDPQSSGSELSGQIILPELKCDKNKGVSTHCTNTLMRFCQETTQSQSLRIQLYLINDPRLHIRLGISHL